MQLLSTSGYSLKEFIGTPPPYAILSHTWGPPEEEVTFEDVTRNLPKAKTKAGFAKIEGSCSLARQDGFEWIWIDSCCIDKSSSAQLSEAINSMYKWYENSTVCYAFLEDFEHENSKHQTMSDEPLGLKDARWFYRGWTLQELIAPSVVIFYDRKWTEIGTKSSLRNEISRVTGIPIAVLTDRGLSSCNAAEKMSWASTRKTTRKEDEAYCLLGLFGVHMPLLYGEGENAFIRLQLEIFKSTFDFTLYAWRHFEKWRTLLAPSPECFCRPDHCAHGETLLKEWDMDEQNRIDYYSSLRSAPILVPTMADIPVFFSDTVVAQLPLSRASVLTSHMGAAVVYLNCHIMARNETTQKLQPIGILCARLELFRENDRRYLGNYRTKPLWDLSHLQMSHLSISQQPFHPEDYDQNPLGTRKVRPFVRTCLLDVPQCFRMAHLVESEGRITIDSDETPDLQILQYRHNHESFWEKWRIQLQLNVPSSFKIDVQRDGDSSCSAQWTDRFVHLTPQHQVSASLRPTLEAPNVCRGSAEVTYILKISCNRRLHQLLIINPQDQQA